MSFNELRTKCTISLAVIMLTCAVSCIPALPDVDTSPPNLPPSKTGHANLPPVIHSLPAHIKVMVRSTNEIICKADDPDGDILAFDWSAGNGIIHGSGNNVTWTAPGTPGVSTITVEHGTTEVPGMQSLARYVRETFPELTVHYIDRHPKPWTVMCDKS